MSCLKFHSLIVVALLSFAFQSVALATPVTTGLNTWLDASDPTTVLDAEGDNALSGFFSGSVQTWVDKSGNGRNAVQATALNQPTYVTNAIGGQSAILTDGLDTSDRDFLRVSAVGGLLKPEYIVVTRVVARTGNDILLSDPANGYHTGTYTVAPGNIGTLASSGAILAQSPLAVGQVGIVRQFFDRGSGSSTSQFAVNGGITNFTLNAGDYAAVSLNTLDIGGFTPALDHSQNAQVAELLIYNNGLNTAERNILENYLSAKYSGTTGVHKAPIVNNLYIGDDNAQGDYDFDVIGIGRESNGAVIASPANEGGALLLSEANGSLDNGDYLVAGNDGTAQALIPYGEFERWSRDFYLDKTGTLDATLTFDFSEAGLTIPPGEGNAIFKLLYSIDGINFDALGMGGSLAGDQVSFVVNNTLLQDGYYTLAITYIPEPSSLLLMLGVLGCGMLRRRRNAANDAKLAA